MLTDKSLSKQMGLQPWISTNFALPDQWEIFWGKNLFFRAIRSYILYLQLGRDFGNYFFSIACKQLCFGFFSLKETFELWFPIQLWTEQRTEAFCFTSPLLHFSCHRKIQACPEATLSWWNKQWFCMVLQATLWRAQPRCSPHVLTHGKGWNSFCSPLVLRRFEVMSCCCSHVCVELDGFQNPGF